MSRIVFAAKNFQKQLNDIAHKHTIICRQLFAGHVVGSRPIKRKKRLHRMIMRVTHDCDKSSPLYTMGVAIEPVKYVKDLRVLISYDLTRGTQVDVAVYKANKILGIVYRTSGPTNQEAFYFVHNPSRTTFL